MDDEIVGYFIEAPDFEKLRRIKDKLYGDGRVLSPDERRDLANLMDVVLSHVEQVDEQLAATIGGTWRGVKNAKHTS